jgi:hypothetical protein
MALRVGDRVVEQARSTARPGRAGVIRTVVHGDPAPRYQIRWDDGHETVYTPAAGSLHRESAAAPARRRTSAKTSGKRAAGKAPGKAPAGRSRTAKTRASKSR